MNSNGDPLAHVETWVDDLNWATIKEAQDNSKLIAQAPELLEVLDDVTAALETMLEHFRDSMTKWPEDVRQREALIDRARKLTDAWRQEVCCPECGSDHVGGPDFEGLYDCGGCGIWFNLNEGMVKREGDFDYETTKS